jgi:uncharacterized lipoprotein
MKRVLVGAAVIALLAACGGGGGMTRADYVKRANSICLDAAKDVQALKIPTRDQLQDIPKAAASIVKVERETLDRLKSIRPPKQDRPEITRWVALVDQTIDQAEMSARSQRDGDIRRALTANLNGAALDQRADQIARSFGLRMCVQASTPPSTTTTTKPAGA